MIVLDTHVWVWWIGMPDLLSKKARRAIDQAVEAGSVYVSAISCWEVSLLNLKGRLELTTSVEDWIAQSEALPFLQFVAIDHRIAVQSTRLPGELHSDPADRMIVATALALGVPLASKDRKIRAYSHISSVW